MSGATTSASGVPFRKNDDDAQPKLPRHFIFGYGSLICPSSRSITAPSLKGRPAQPVLVRNVQRTWTARVGGVASNDPRLTAMGVRCHRGARCSGVLIEVNDEELEMFDVRESGYDRVEVNAENVEGVPGLDDHEMHDGDHAVFVAGRRRSGGGEEKPGAEVDAIEGRYVRDEDEEEENEVKVWMYVQREPIPADRVHPIAQSYVDIILRGCLTISQSFARSFLDTTHGWWHDGTEGERISGGNAEAAEEGSIEDTKLPKSLTANARASHSDDDGHHTWIDDRHDPLYVRADSEYSSAMGETIDGLINDHHPEALRKRRMYRAAEHALPAAEKDPEEFD